MSFLLYNSVVKLYAFSIRLAAMRNGKAKQWVEGRFDWRKKLSDQITQLGSGERIWFHCASYGEFEQGRPVMEEWRRRDPSVKIILSFFSPSGYTAFHNWPGADVVVYLPIDSKQNARDFLELIQASKIVFVKYEFWLHFLFEIKQRSIPAYLISATFKAHHPFFKWYGGIFKKSLFSFSNIFVQDQASLNALLNIGVNHTVLSGDTRFDRVIEIRQQAREIAGITEFKATSYLIVAGSTWQKDEQLLAETFKQLKNSGVKLIIAPHQLHSKTQADTLSQWQQSGIDVCLFSKGIRPNSQVLILDAMGLLSSIYRYAELAYIGGGLDEGIHNTLEPTVYGIPVCFSGSGHEKFNEAVSLIARGDAFYVQDAAELTALIHHLQHDSSLRVNIKKDLENYFSENSQVTTKILDFILNKVP